MKINLLLLATASTAHNLNLERICDRINNHNAQTKKVFTIRYPNLMNFCRQQKRKTVNTDTQTISRAERVSRQAICRDLDIKSWQYSVFC